MAQDKSSFQSPAHDAKKAPRRPSLCRTFLRVAAELTAGVTFFAAAGLGLGAAVLWPSPEKFSSLTHEGRAANLGGYSASSSYYELNSNFSSAEHDDTQFMSFIKGHASFENALKTANEKSTRTEDRRIAFYKKAVELSRQIANPYIKACAIEGLVNYALTYDSKKANEAYIVDDETWMQPPLLTAKTAKGVCVDFAGLKVSLLVMCGLDPKDVYYLTLLNKNPQATAGHAVCLVRMGNRNLILNNTPPSVPSDPKLLPECALPIDDFVFFNNNDPNNGYQPVLARSPTGSIVYKSNCASFWSPPDLDDSHVVADKLDQDLKLRDQVLELGQALYEHNTAVKLGQKAELPSISDALNADARQPIAKNPKPKSLAL